MSKSHRHYGSNEIQKWISLTVMAMMMTKTKQRQCSTIRQPLFTALNTLKMNSLSAFCSRGLFFFLRFFSLLLSLVVFNLSFFYPFYSFHLLIYYLWISSFSFVAPLHLMFVHPFLSSLFTVRVISKQSHHCNTAYGCLLDSCLFVVRFSISSFA